MKRFLIVTIGFAAVCLGIACRPVVIAETRVSNVIVHDGTTYYLSIRGRTNPPSFGGDGPFTSWLTMNIEGKVGSLQKEISSNNECREDEVREIIKRQHYSLSVEDGFPHVFVAYDGQRKGFFHLGARRLIWVCKPLDAASVSGYAIDRAKADLLVPEQVDLADYDNYFHVNEHLTGALARPIFCDDERSLIIVGDKFESHSIVYTKGDAFIADRPHRHTVVSEKRIFIVAPNLRMKMNPISPVFVSVGGSEGG
ncbi:MAG: hypothetical protein DHS20C16_04670 [Phycisphaerae bacterium]|nr:MAG: hypothetical protein DHS20C16_04670 [Phycisphaerae bacterium]